MNKTTQQPTGMAYRYEQAWTICFYDSNDWKQKQIIEDPFGQYASDLAHEAAKLAESDKPIVIDKKEKPWQASRDLI